ncbi:YfjI family protein [Hymenobacter sp. BT730]|uniref:YfjI family protein n=1 Tax=Hymenobacter sp. BT730 TaxID=3063332 RepID=UPI0026E009A6|nr:YfjI family protein [Hymenobacter sp. BT730]
MTPHLNYSDLLETLPAPPSLYSPKDTLPDNRTENQASQHATDALTWCLQHFSSGPSPQGENSGRNNWLTKLTLFCNERGVPRDELLSWALQHCDGPGHGPERIKPTIEGIYNRHQAAHNCRPYMADGKLRGMYPPLPVTAEEWGLPLPVVPALLPVPVFDKSLFPPPLRPALLDIAHRMQSPPDWLGMGALTMLGSLIGTRCGIWPKQQDTSWKEVPNLWGAIIAEPSRLKTPTLNAAIAPLKRLEKEAQAAYVQAEKEHAADAEVLKIRREALRSAMGAAAKKKAWEELEKLKQELLELDAVALPAPPRYLANDCTVEKLTELLGENPRGLLMFRDELTGLLQSWEKQGHENDRAFYLEGWNGTSSYSSDRIGRGTTLVPHCCLSLLGGIQPDKIEPYLAQTVRGQNDGMLQRLQLLSWPDARPYHYVDAAPNAQAQDELQELLRRLDTLDVTLVGAHLLPGEAIPCFHFESGAQLVFIEWLTALERKLTTPGELPALVQHLAKYRKLLPCLALVFHLLDIVAEGVTGPVSLSALQLAIRWCTYLEAHARRLYGYGASAQRSAAALGEQLQRRTALPTPFTARDVERRNWRGLNSKGAVQEALEELVALNWLREVPVAAKPTGRPPAPAYQPNPLLLSSN